MWFGKSEKALEHTHIERMKCLEMGFPLPDAELAWVQAVQLRGGQITAVLIVGTIALAVAPVGATAILLALGKDLFAVWALVPMLLLIWGVNGYLLFTLLRHGMQSLGQIKRPADFVVKPVPAPPQPNGKPREVPEVLVPPSEPPEVRLPSDAIQEGWYARPGATETK
jgi:hypothetical protein